MTTVYNPDGTVTVHSAGDHTLTELQSEAALRFAHEHGKAVDWPALVRTTELGRDNFAATFVLADSRPSSASADRAHALAGV